MNENILLIEEINLLRSEKDNIKVRKRQEAISCTNPKPIKNIMKEDKILKEKNKIIENKHLELNAIRMNINELSDDKKIED